MAFNDTMEFIKNNFPAGTEIRNWTAANDYLGDTFTIDTINNDYITVISPNAQNVQNVPVNDFQLVYDMWDQYIDKNIGRAQIRDITRFSKYIISIFHQVSISNENSGKLL